MDLKKRVLSFALAALTLTSLQSCKKEQNEDLNVSCDTVIESSEEEKSLEDLLHECLYDENIDYNTVINTYLNTNFNARENLKNDYLRAIYMYLLSTGVPMETYIKELNNVIVLQQNPSDCHMSWDEAFHNLSLTLKDYPSLFDMYIDLAIFTHELECECKHEINDLGIYTCPKLSKTKED